MVGLLYKTLDRGVFHPGGRGGGTQVLNGYLLPNSPGSRGGQNLGVVNSFEGQKRGCSTFN